MLFADKLKFPNGKAEPAATNPEGLSHRWRRDKALKLSLRDLPGPGAQGRFTASGSAKQVLLTKQGRSSCFINIWRSEHSLPSPEIREKGPWRGAQFPRQGESTLLPQERPLPSQDVWDFPLQQGKVTEHIAKQRGHSRPPRAALNQKSGRTETPLRWPWGS